MDPSRCITKNIATEFCFARKINKAAIWQREDRFILYLASSHTNYVVALAKFEDPYNPRLFKTLDAAVKSMTDIGLNIATLHMEEKPGEFQ